MDEFYTDSKSDYPFAALAAKAYFVKKNSIKIIQNKDVLYE